MYTANDIRKIQVSLGLVEESEVGADLSKRYTAEDIAAIQKRNAQIGQEQLRLEGRPPSMVQTPATRTQTEDRTVSGWLSRNASDFMDFIFPNPENETVFNTYNQWLESGTEEQSTRRRNLIGSFGTLEKVIAQEVVGGKLELTGTMEEMVNQRLIEKGYTPEEIAEARQMMEYKSELPSWYGLLHRPDSSATGIANQAIGGAAATAGAVLQGAEDLVTGTETPAADMTGPARALYQMGSEISAEGDRRLQEARLGLTDAQEFAYDLAESTGENLLPVLLGAPWLLMVEQVARSAGGGVLDMAEQGRSAGTAALSGLGHGAISYLVERAGIGQMARNMGMNTSMGRAVDSLLDTIANAPGMNRLPGWVAGTLASAGEEGAEEFVQTYLDTALDKVLGSDTPGLLSGELLGQAAQSAAMGFAAGGAIGAVSSGIGAARQTWQSPRPEEVADQQLQAAVERAGQVGQAMQVAQQTETLAEPQTEAVPKEAQPPATQAELSLVDAYLAANGNRLEGDVWELLRKKRPETQVQAQTQETRPLPAPVKGAEETGTAEPIQRAWNDAQQEQALLLGSETSMTEAAVTVAVDAMPEDVSPSAYSVAANSLYQLGRQGVAKDVEDALWLAERGGARVGDVLATPGGESALRQIYNQGRLESLEAQSRNPAGLAPAETAGTVEYEPGALVPEEDRVLIDLFAAASDTAVTVREKLENDAGGYIDTALGKVVFGAEAGADTFGTILHESSHWYDSWDREGGRELQNELIRYLAEQRGFESVGALIEGYIQEYQNAGQELSYAQACEELTADALRGVFDSKESISRWIEKQQQLAAQSQEQRGAVDRMMGAVRELLNKIIEKAKSILSTDPGNAAARQAQQLAEDQKRALEERYYQHAETAMAAEREARAQQPAETRETGALAERADTAETIRQSAGTQTAETGEPAREYQIPVTDTKTRSGQQAAAWENVDRAAIEKELEAAYQSGANQIPIENIKSFAQRLLRTEQSRANQITIAKKLERLSAYLSGGQVDGNAAFAAAEDIAETIMQKSGRMDRELWEQYPDLHYHTVFVRRGGPEYKELLYRYGDYATAQKELAKFGIKLTTGEAHADSAIDKVYQSLSSDYGELFPADITDAMGQVDRIAQIREMIKPKIQNNYGENWEEAKADLAMRIVGGLVSEGVTDKTVARLLNQRIDEGLNRHRTEIRIRVTKALGDLERSNRLAARKDAQRIVSQAAEGNRRRAEAWAKMNRNQRIALAQSKDALQRARNARSADATRRAIAANVTKINRMLKNPTKEAYFPKSLLSDALAIAKIGNAAAHNKDAIESLQKIENRFKEYLNGDGSEKDISIDLKKSGIIEMLARLRNSMELAQERNSRLEQQADNAARLLERGLNQMYDRQSEQEAMLEVLEGDGANRLDRMTVYQLNEIRDLTSAILTVARNANKLMTIQKAQAASQFARQAVEEVRTAPARRGDRKGISNTLKRGEEFFHENVLNAERFFALLGGFRHGGAMEALAASLSDGEAKRNRIIVEGSKKFANVMEGKENQKRYKEFSGTGANLVTVSAFTDSDGNPAQMTEAMATTLLLHLGNSHNSRNILLGGITIPSMKEYVKGDLKEAKRKGQLYRFKYDLKGQGDYLAAIPKAKESVQNALSDYGNSWAETSREFLNGFTKDYINETSMMMYGFEKATVDNYVPLPVDPDVVEQQNEGVVHNSTIEGRGFLKSRNEYAVNPVMLEEIDQVVMRSLKDTADYAGLAPAIRDFNMVWNANRKEKASLAATVGREFGDGAVKFIKEYISDLQKPRQSDRNLVTVLGGALRGGLARGVLSLNIRVSLGQISGVFGYGSELGAEATREAVKYMATNHGAEKDAAIRQEMMDWGYYGLESTLSEGSTTEIAERRSRKNSLQKASDKLGLGNTLELMDKKTREAGWIGSKHYVKKHLAEYGLTEADAQTESDRYKAAVVAKMTQATNRTQPNYTMSQLAAIQRSPDQLAKLFTMFKTQGFQNYGIAQYAVEDYRAQRSRLKDLEHRAANPELSIEQRQRMEERLSAARQDLSAAKQRLLMAAGGLAAQGLVYSMIAALVDFVFYKKDDDLRDEEGKITPVSAVTGVGLNAVKAATTDNVFLLPEIMGTLGNIIGIRNTEPVSLPGLDSLGDLSSSLLSFCGYYTSTAESAKKALSDAEIDSLWDALTDIEGTVRALKNGGVSASEAIDKTTDLAGNVFMILGVPASNVKRLAEGVTGWAKDIYTAAQTDGIDLGDVINTPTSSSQYDDLYTAVFENGDPADAQDAIEALQKLDLINPPKKPSDAKAGDTKIISELLKREKESGNLIEDAAAARVAGNGTQQQKLMQQLVNTLADALGINPKTKDGQRRLTTVINKVNTAISDEVRAQMGADSSTGATIYTPVLNALETGSGLKDALTVLRRAGIQDEDIRRAVQTAYKEDYLYSDDAGRVAIENKLLSLKDANGEPYFTEDQLAGWITDWELKGFNESVYTDLDEALQSRNRLTAQEEIFRYMNAGKSADSIHDRIVALYRDVYLAAGQAQRQELARFLVGLRGPKGEKLVSTDTLVGWIKDEAKNK